MQTTVTKRGQTVVPAKIRRAHHITPEMKLEWIDDGEVISVMPISVNPIKAMRGMFKNTKLRKALLESRTEERKRG